MHCYAVKSLVIFKFRPQLEFRRKDRIYVFASTLMFFVIFIIFMGKIRSNSTVPIIYILAANFVSFLEW